MTVISVNVTAPEPVYEQVRRQVAGLIAAGTLVEGDRLPTITALASDLGVAPNTVARAYKELEAAGLVQTRRRTGTVVASLGTKTDDRVTGKAAEYAHAARQAGLTDTQAIDLLRGALQQLG